ncbi:3942_t:CDS:2 [Ambispora gerdemannii]|uniref:3942_t:CDS:1 n=1 Tax=Ambispora gerdemannii TaxID=144530 RepID=A0A9N9GQU8_9GLOM|nr:3942_t:CDS:2 [Ambispora gerdemannii]
MANTQFKINSLQELNSRLITTIAELRKENADVKAENTKLKQDKEEIEARFVKLEQSDKENVDLRAEVAKLRHDIEEIKLQIRVNTNEWDMPSFAEQSHLRGTEDISHSSTSSPLPVTSPSPIQNSTKPIANTTASKTRCKSSSAIQDLSYGSTETILSKNDQDGNLCDMKTVPSGNDRDVNLSRGTKTIRSENDQTEISDLEQDVECDKNEIVEQGLIEELHLSTDKQCLIDSAIDSAIDNTNSTENKGPAQHLSYLFKTAIKSRQQELLNWYYYSLEFENRVHVITTDGKIKDKTARTMIYKEMKPFLPNITQDNLRKKTLRARKLLMLFGENGVDQVKSKTVPPGNDQALPETKVSITTTPSNSISEVKSLLEVEICEEIDQDSDPSKVKIQSKTRSFGSSFNLRILRIIGGAGTAKKLPKNSGLKTLAYNILKETGDIVQDTENLEPLQCSICKEKILTLTYESFTILSGCGHIFHRMCIEKKILYTTPSICPFTGCSRSVENIDETQRRVSVSSEISGTSNLADEFTRNVGFSSSQKTSSQDQDVDMDGNEGTGHRVEILSNLPQKRVNEATPTASSSNKKIKKPVNREESAKLKKLIDELLSSDSSQTNEAIEESASSHAMTASTKGNANDFLYFFRKIDQSESKYQVTNREVISSHFDFGGILYNRYKDLKKDNGKEGANALLFDEVRKQIPIEVTDGALRKRTERARKIYRLFTAIIKGDEKLAKQKIALIRSFSAYSISSLSRDDINFVIVKCLKTTK